MIPGAVGAVGAVLIAVWLTGGLAANRAEVTAVEDRLPAPPEPRETRSLPPLAFEEVGRHTTSDGVAAKLTGGWPRFRGRNSDGIATGQPELARAWSADGPPVRWRIALGEGHGGAAVLNGRVFLLDYDAAGRRDAVRCLSLADGREIWRFSYPSEVPRQYGMSRTVPAVTDECVVTLGPNCHVCCVDARTGRFKWGYDLVSRFNAETPPWRAGQCPLIDRGNAIIGVGGDVLMMAVACKTGEVRWRTPNPRGWKMTHSSVIPMEFKGRRMYLYCASGGIVGVSAEDGRVLWESDAWRVPFANIPCPVVLGGGRIFLAGGYGAGSLLLRLRESGGRLAPEVVYRLKESQFSAEQQTPVFHRGYLYSVDVNGKLACLDPRGGGRLLWAGRGSRKFGRGPYVVADGLMYVLNDTGWLSLIEPRAEGFRELSAAKVLPAAHKQSWGPMAVANGLLLCRDLSTMVCLDIGGRSE